MCNKNNEHFKVDTIITILKKDIHQLQKTYLLGGR